MNLSSHLMTDHDPHKWRIKIIQQVEQQREIIKLVSMNNHTLQQSKILLIKGIKETLRVKLNQVVEQAQRFTIDKSINNQTLKYFPSGDSYIVVSDRCLRQVHMIQKSSMMKLQELINKKNNIRKGLKRLMKSQIEEEKVVDQSITIVVPNTKMISSIILNPSTYHSNQNNFQLINSFKASKQFSKIPYPQVVKDQQRLYLGQIVKEIRLIHSKNNHMIKVLKHGYKQQEQLMIWFKFRLDCLEEEIKRKGIVGDVSEIEEEEKRQSETTGSPNEKEDCLKYQLNKSTKGSSIRKNLLLVGQDPSSNMSYHHTDLGHKSIFVLNNQSIMISNILEKQPNQLSNRSVSGKSHKFQPRGGREMSIPNSSASNANCSRMFSNNNNNNFYYLQTEISYTNNDSTIVVMEDNSRSTVNDNNYSNNNTHNDGGREQIKEKKLQLWEIRLKELNQAKKKQQLKQLSQKLSQQKQKIPVANTEHNFSKKVQNPSIQIVDKNLPPFSSTKANPPSKSKLNQFLSKINLESNKENTTLNINIQLNPTNQKANLSTNATQPLSESRRLLTENIFGQANVNKEQNIFMTKQNSSSSNPFSSGRGSMTPNQQNPFCSNPFENPFGNPFGSTQLSSSKKSNNCFTQNGFQSSNPFSNKMSNNPFSNPFQPSSNYSTSSQERIFGSNGNTSQFSSINRMKNIFL